jgi:NADH:ubiquinone oxidoreductase subunit 2 (subunit N)
VEVEAMGCHAGMTKSVEAINNADAYGSARLAVDKLSVADAIKHTARRVRLHHAFAGERSGRFHGGWQDVVGILAVMSMIIGNSP